VSDKHRPAGAYLSRNLPVFLFLAVSIVILVIDSVNGSSVKDIDDIARKLQIRDLLTDGDWYDLTWPFLATDPAYTSPWSRLVDLPYILVTKLFQPVLGMESAFLVARFIVPPLWLAAYSYLAVKLMKVFLGEDLRLAHVAAAAAASLFAVIEFMPTRIDHHNVQMVFLLMVCLGVVSSHRYAGILLAAGSILSVAVGLECIPYIAVAMAGVALYAALDPASSMTRRLTWMGLTLLVVTIPVSLVLNGPSVWQTQCDALSLPWISVLMLGGIVATTVPAIWRVMHMTAALPRLIVLACVGAGALMILWLSFPECHSGPYPMVNDVARTYWLSNVIQEVGPAAAFARGEYMLAAIFLFLLGLMIAALLTPRARASSIVIILAMGIAGVTLTCFQMRNFKFPSVILPLLLPLFICHVRQTRNIRLLYPVLAIPLSILVAFMILVKPDKRDFTLIDYMEGDHCQQADFSALDRVPPSRIMAPLGLSLTIAQHISQTGSGHTVAPLPFHRASPDMKRMFEVFVLTDPEVRRKALENFDYIAICRLPETDADAEQAPLFGVLSSGKDWPGLEDVPQESETRLRLLKIGHDKLK